MIIYKNVSKFKSLQFEDYLKIPAHSHSSLKQMKDGVSRDFVVTDKVRIGKLVDQIRMEGTADIADPLYRTARNIAEKIRSELGDSVLSMFTSQSSYSGIMEDYETGLQIKIKGRPDWELGNIAIIDLKVTENAKSVEDCVKLIEYMGYDNQIWNYKKLAEAESKQIRSRKSFFFIFSKKVQKTFFIQRLTNDLQLDLAENWWLNKIQEHGTIY